MVWEVPASGERSDILKIICDSRDLVNAVNIALRAVPSNTSMEVLKCILITAESGGITITANDMEIGLVTTLNGTVQDIGQTLIEAKVLNEISKKLPSGDVTISVGENRVATIKSGRSKFEIPTRDPDEFTGLPNLESGQAATVEQEYFRDAVLGTIFCAEQKNDTNPLMGGVKVEVANEAMTFTALDGHRIGFREIPARGADGASTVLPARSLNEVSKILKDGEMTVEFTQNHVRFTIGETEVVSRNIFGNYFNTDNILKQYAPNTVIHVDTDELLACITRATVVIREGEKKPVVLDITDGRIGISARTTLGTVDEEIEIEKQGADIRIGMNPRFLIDALRQVGQYDEEAEIRLIGPKAPVLITKDDAAYKYVVLPVNM